MTRTKLRDVVAEKARREAIEWAAGVAEGISRSWLRTASEWRTSSGMGEPPEEGANRCEIRAYIARDIAAAIRKGPETAPKKRKP